MACTPGRGRMAAMERLLSSPNAMEPSSEEASHEKLAAQTIQKEMNEADEVNLLEEEDMHVFDWKPLTDPLHLVSCKTCKKPIKASQYAAHAERCRSISTSDDTGLELDGGSGHKRPPRKARKKVQTAHENQATGTGDQEVEPFDGDDTAASESANVDDSQTVKASSLGRELKKSSTSLDGSFAVDLPVVGPGSANYLEGAMSPSKRTKLLPIQSSLTSDTRLPIQSSLTSNTLDSMCGVTIESGMCCNGLFTCKLHSESLKRTVKGRSQLYDALLEEHNAKLIQKNDRKCKDANVTDIPAPLATKIYYPSQNQRFRAVLGQLYRESLTKENSNESSIPRSLAGDSGLQSGNIQILSPDNNLSDLMGQKKDLSTRTSMSLLRRSEQMLPPTSEIGHTIANGHPSHMNFQNQYHENKFSRPHLPIEAGTTGIMRSRMLPTPYTYTGTTGTSMGSIQQPNGIVPVI